MAANTNGAPPVRSRNRRNGSATAAGIHCSVAADLAMLTFLNRLLSQCPTPENDLHFLFETTAAFPLKKVKEAHDLKSS